MLFRGDRKKKEIAITFDDGPSDDTPRLLEVLRNNGARATFFITGEMVAGREATLLQAKLDGHAFGNHTYSHKNVWFRSRKSIEEDFRKCDTELARAGITTDLARFPQLKFGINALLVCRKLKKKIINSTLLSLNQNIHDWYQRDPEKVAELTLRKLKKGSILIFHDYLQGIGPHPEVVPIMESLLPKLKERGYSFVTIPEL